MMPDALSKPVVVGPAPAAPHRATPCAGLFGWRVPTDRPEKPAKTAPVHQPAR